MEKKIEEKCEIKRRTQPHPVPGTRAYEGQSLTSRHADGKQILTSLIALTPLTKFDSNRPESLGDDFVSIAKREKPQFLSPGTDAMSSKN